MLPMPELSPIVLPVEDLPAETGWLWRQVRPVLAWGKGSVANADVVVSSESELLPLLAAIEARPLAAATLVQVLRTVESLPLPLAMNVESLAYGVLQAGPEFQRWLSTREGSPALLRGEEGDPAILLSREGDVVIAELNRPRFRNSISAEMRDALLELLELVLLDETIARVEVSGGGGCFSVGGELREFGLAPDPASAHAIRASHNPGRLLAQCADRVRFHVHSACIGSGVEIPAFANYVSASSRSFFQLPELEFGLIPGAGGCVSISRRIGRQRTAWMALSGKRIKAAQALEWGLIDEIRESA
jgi:enoyl-CoA hydratase/carnithine racemase